MDKPGGARKETKTIRNMKKQNNSPPEEASTKKVPQQKNKETAA
jgi:hypothetical protein